LEGPNSQDLMYGDNCVSRVPGWQTQQTQVLTAVVTDTHTHTHV